MSDRTFLHLEAFLGERECALATERLMQTPMYAIDAHYRSTCYGGTPGFEPNEPMPPWLAAVRRRIELNLGVVANHFNFAALLCFEDDDARTDWLTMSAAHIGALGRLALITVGADTEFHVRSAARLNDRPSPPTTLRAGTLTVAPPGVAVRSQWRLQVGARTNQRKRSAPTGTGDPVRVSWHILFFQTCSDEPTKVQTVRELYRQYRYGAQLSRVLAEPHVKLELQHFVRTARRKRQLRIDQVLPQGQVKKEPR